MSTKKDELDLLKEEVLRQEAQPEKRTTGPSQRRKRMESNAKAKGVKKTMISIRIDNDLLENFKELSGGSGYQRAINQALREWWVARDISDLVASQLQELSDKLCLQITTQVAEELKKAS